MGLLDGKVAIVTGASSGIGRAIAQRYAQDGAKVVVADTREEAIEGETTVRQIEAAGGEAIFISTDIADQQAVITMMRQAVDRFGRLDILVNNAAVYTSTNLLQTTPEQWAKVIDVNVTGFFYCSQQAVLQMLRQEPVNGVRGRIINIASQHGMVACPGDFPYSVSKGAIVQMTHRLQCDSSRQDHHRQAGHRQRP